MSKTLEEQAQEIIKIAEDSGVQSNYLFRTTFQRYIVQVENASRLEAGLKATQELTVTKSYQKNRDNIYTNPLFTEYNRVTDSANKTVSTLLKIIREFGVGESQQANKEKDELMAAINGGDDYDEEDN